MRGARYKRQAVLLTAVGLATVLNYLGWLGWDQHRDVHPDGSTTGPYEAWQVIGVAVILAALAFAVGSFGLPWLGTLVIAVAMTASFAIDASSDSNSDGLWPIGAFLVLVGTAIGSLLVGHHLFSASPVEAQRHQAGVAAPLISRRRGSR